MTIIRYDDDDELMVMMILVSWLWWRWFLWVDDDEDSCELKITMIKCQGDIVSAWMMDLVAEEKAARKKEKISNFDLKSIIGISESTMSKRVISFVI